MAGMQCDSAGVRVMMYKHSESSCADVYNFDFKTLTFLMFVCTLYFLFRKPKLAQALTGLLVSLRIWRKSLGASEESARLEMSASKTARYTTQPIEGGK